MKRALIALIVITACALAQAVVCFSEEKAHISYDLDMEILINEQAAVINTRVLYENAAGEDMDNLFFSLPANVFRRESTLPYDNETLEKAFPYGYAPAGCEMHAVTVNGESADWAAVGENESFLRVEADVKAGEKAEISFFYTLLLSRNRAFLGMDDTDIRFSGFYPSLLVYEDGDFAMNPVARAGEYHYSDISSFHVDIVLPFDYDVASAGVLKEEKTGDRKKVSIELDSARELSFAVSRKFHVRSEKTPSGVTVSAYGQDRIALGRMVNQAMDAVCWLEKNIAPFPHGEFVLVDASCAGKNLSSSACVFLADGKDSQKDIFKSAALQYFSDRVHPNPVMEAWLTDGLSEYIAMIAIRETEGEKAYGKLLNESVFPALQITIPGGLTPLSESTRFQTISEYEFVVSLRGAAALHEIENAMGEEAFLEGIRTYYGLFAYKTPVSDDFVRAFETSSGRSWADAIYHWMYTIGDYSGENLYEYD